jgi:hypothetical protein
MSSVNISSDDNKCTRNPISSIKQDPHTLRLLRLILEGTVENAEEAASHLSTLASTNFSPAQLWDILGRLQEGLTSNAWQTRTNSALALEGVAKCLPTSDQYNFLTLTPWQETFKEVDKSTGRVSNEEKNISYFSINDLTEDSGFFDSILKNGRLLLSTSQSQYDAMEDELLFRHDYLNLPEGETYPMEGCKLSGFAGKRAKIQRIIIAKRLGLATLGKIIGNTDDLIPVSDDDIQSTQQHENIARKRQSLSEKVVRKKQKVCNSDCGNASRSVRSLLTGEIRRTHLSRLGSEQSHVNPQTILANELMFRMFDRSWHVRHGSLLGICSLIRAWKYSTIMQKYNSVDGFIDPNIDSSVDSRNNNESSFIFGAWPHDILVRCIFIFMLDRFGDFSGTCTTISTKWLCCCASTGGGRATFHLTIFHGSVLH